uniref:Uncharacterized protein n=1 Tax=Anguilla anguilla TaxID=7936 RepID=A0A0E9TRB0_ANGAN
MGISVWGIFEKMSPMSCKITASHEGEKAYFEAAVIGKPLVFFVGCVTVALS